MTELDSGAAVKQMADVRAVASAAWLRHLSDQPALRDDAAGTLSALMSLCTELDARVASLNRRHLDGEAERRQRARGEQASP